MNKHQQNIVLLTVLVIIVSISAQCGKSSMDAHGQSQSGPGTATGVTRASDPVLRGEASGEVQPFNLTRENLRASIFAHPVPNVWLAFSAGRTPDLSKGDLPSENGSKVRVELPSEAKEVLLHHWEAALAYYYNTEIAGMPDAESSRREAVTFANSNLVTTRKLRALQIDVSDGRRNIIQDEAGSLAAFISAAASDVVQEAKKYR